MTNSTIRPIDWTLSVETTSSQSRLGSHRNEGVLDIHQSFRVGASLSDCLMSRKLVGGVLSLYIEAVGVFYSAHPTGPKRSRLPRSTCEKTIDSLKRKYSHCLMIYPGFDLILTFLVVLY